MPKYDALATHLRRQKTASYEMTFSDIERVIAALLPKRARRPEWWANDTSPENRHVQRHAWLSAGFKAYPQIDKEHVRFVRS